MPTLGQLMCFFSFARGFHQLYPVASSRPNCTIIDSHPSMASMVHGQCHIHPHMHAKYVILSFTQ